MLISAFWANFWQFFSTIFLDIEKFYQVLSTCQISDQLDHSNRTYRRGQNPAIPICKKDGLLRVKISAEQNKLPRPRGAYVKILTGMLVLFCWVWNLAKSYFFGFCKISAIFWVWQISSYFFWVWQISSYFLGFSIFVSNTRESFEWRTQYWKTKSYSNSFSYLFKLWPPLHLESFYFLGLNFGAFYFFGFKFRVILFFGVVEICSRTSIPVKEMLVYPPPPPPLGAQEPKQ